MIDDLPPDDEFLAWLDIEMHDRYWINNTEVEGRKGGEREDNQPGEDETGYDRTTH